MSVRRKMKRTTKQYIIVAIICIIVMGGAAIFTAIMITGQVEDRYSTLLAKARQEMEDNKRTVYIATAPIMSGDYITEENVMRQIVYATQPEETYITAEDIGKVALVDIATGIQVIKGMLSEKIISSELRELEYTVINISTNIANNDTVDVRISYPNGESYVVLSKKIMKGYMPEAAACLFWMNEEELLRMSAAIVDAGLYSGSSLYVTKYIEPNIQEASIVNYIPSLSVISLLESDPNILEKATQELSREVRKSLENRLADSLSADVAEINWDVNPNVQSIATHTSTSEPASASDSASITEPASASETVSTPEPVETGNTEDATLEEKIITPGTGELGSTEAGQNYFYFAEEQEAMEGDVEYGE